MLIKRYKCFQYRSLVSYESPFISVQITLKHTLKKKVGF